MPWRIIKTTDGQHVGTTLAAVQAGDIVTFEDGDVVAIDQIFLSQDGTQMVAAGANYQMTLKQE